MKIDLIKYSERTYKIHLNGAGIGTFTLHGSVEITGLTSHRISYHYDQHTIGAIAEVISNATNRAKLYLDYKNSMTFEQTVNKKSGFVYIGGQKVLEIARHGDSELYIYDGQHQPIDGWNSWSVSQDFLKKSTLRSIAVLWIEKHLELLRIEEMERVE